MHCAPVIKMSQPVAGCGHCLSCTPQPLLDVLCHQALCARKRSETAASSVAAALAAAHKTAAAVAAAARIVAQQQNQAPCVVFGRACDEMGGEGAGLAPGTPEGTRPLVAGCSPPASPPPRESCVSPISALLSARQIRQAVARGSAQGVIKPLSIELPHRYTNIAPDEETVHIISTGLELPLLDADDDMTAVSVAMDADLCDNDHCALCAEDGTTLDEPQQLETDAFACAVVATASAMQCSAAASGGPSASESAMMDTPKRRKRTRMRPASPLSDRGTCSSPENDAQQLQSPFGVLAPQPYASLAQGAEGTSDTGSDVLETLLGHTVAGWMQRPSRAQVTLWALS